MLGKRTRPSVKRLLDPIIPGDRSVNPDPILSPTSPLEFKFRSPNVWKNQDSGRIGLAIVAALEKSDGTGDSVFQPKVIVGSCSLTRSDPIPIVSGKIQPKLKEDVDEIRCSESYTCVTYHGPDQVPRTRVYCDGGEFRGSEYDRKRLMNVGVLYESSPRLMDEISSFRSSDFLSSCHLCGKMLHGKDIYMYRGEKAFCSVECRSKQIASDERKEKFRSGASKSSDIPSVLCSGSKLFTPGIVAA